MPLSPNEELELLELEEAEYQSKKNSAPKSEMPTINQSESALRGGIQGATMGFGDELSGLGAAGSKLLTGNLDTSDLYHTYRQKQQEEQERNKLSQQANPTTYGASEIGGSAASTLALGPLGLLGQGVRGAALAGGVLGGLQGIGTSEGTIETPGKLINDASTNTLLGAGLGAAVPAVGSAISQVAPKVLPSLAELASKVVPKNAKTAYNLGKEGVNISNPEQVARRQMSGSSDIIDTILRSDKKLGKDVGKSVEGYMGATRLSDNVLSSLDDVSKAVAENPLALGTKQSSLIQSEIENIQNDPMLAPKDLYDRLQQLRSIQTNDPKIQEVLSRAQNEFSNFTKQSLPEYGKAAQNFSQFREAVPETILGKGNEYSAKRFGDLNNKDEKLSSALNTLIKSTGSKGASSLEGQKTLTQLLDKINELKTNKNIPSEIAKNVEGLPKQIQKQADEFSVFSSPNTLQEFSFQSPLKSVASLGNKVANKTGEVVQRLNKALYSAPKEEVSVASNQLRQANIPGTESILNSLDKSIESGDTSGKDRAIFLLLQNPEARKILSPTTEEE